MNLRQNAMLFFSNLIEEADTLMGKMQEALQKKDAELDAAKKKISDLERELAAHQSELGPEDALSNLS